MKVAFTNGTNGIVGGAERYVGEVARRLVDDGHEVGLWYEGRHAPHYESLPLDVFSQAFELQRMEEREWVDSLATWKPDLIFGQGLSTNSAEVSTLEVAPSVYFAHDYKCVCISGSKSHRFPGRDVCLKPLDAMCLVHYLPRRCGGSNPFTMITAYRKATTRLQVVKLYTKVVTHSRWVQTEYARNEVLSDLVPYFSTAAKRAGLEWQHGKVWTLLVLGRMVKLKGGDILIRALPRIAEGLQSFIKVRFVGDGPALADLQSLAGEVEREHSNVKCEFVGWLPSAALDQAMDGVDLHVMPGFWPEPYGMVGLETASRGIPTVAFAVGGITEWLKHDESGVLARFSPPLERHLGDAIIACLASPDKYRTLREGALAISEKLNLQRHYAALCSVFESVLTRKRPTECLEMPMADTVKREFIS